MCFKVELFFDKKKSEADFLLRQFLKLQNIRCRFKYYMFFALIIKLRTAMKI